MRGGSNGGAAGEPDGSELLRAIDTGLSPELLERALTHRSYAYENGGLPTNERLEFLGDAVLGLIVTDTLFRRYPDLPEGQLAKLRAAVVQMRALADVARSLRLGSYVRLGRGEEGTGGRDKSSILADTLEALIGAVYHECGLVAAHNLVHRLFDPVIDRSAGLGAGLDWKTSLQELTASGFLGVPEYHVEESGPDHQKFFRATVRVGGRAYGSGSGRSKKEAEQQAAEAAWKAISNGTDSATDGCGRGGPGRERCGHGGPGRERAGRERPGRERCGRRPRSAGQRRPSGCRARGARQQARRGRRARGRARRRLTVPELPEVETVRSGLDKHVVGRTIDTVEVLHPRAVRRHLPGPADFEAVLRGRTFTGARRRGKYLWLPLGEDALLAHLGMSGQLLVGDPGRPVSGHVRARFTFTDQGPDLRFTDQRTFGHLVWASGGADLPALIAHIAPDPFEPAFDDGVFIARLRARRTGLKRALLDQSLVSGIGNIYADEALWRARLHWARATDTLSRAEAARVLAAVRDVLADALQAGGTSFDSLYVNVNGESGYFSRSLCVYGQEGKPCPRCGTPIRRDAFMNRSAYSCPRCQPQPRSRRYHRDLHDRST